MAMVMGTEHIWKATTRELEIKKWRAISNCGNKILVSKYWITLMKVEEWQWAKL